MSYKEFMEEVEVQLKEYSPEQLRELLKDWAHNTPSLKRDEFLQKLKAVESDEEEKDRSKRAILEEINELKERVESGEYSLGWGWDDELEKKREFGDESWTVEVDGFLDTAYDAFHAGRYELAEEIYRVMFDILEMGEEPGHLPGPKSPNLMVDTNLDEAMACYLRAVYEVTSLDERPERLFDEMDRWTYYIYDLDLKKIIETTLSEPADLDVFLSRWKEMLREKEGDFAEELLREVLRLSEGVEGIAELARNKPEEHPEAYVDWICALKEEEDYPAMRDAAEEGLKEIPDDYVVRSEVAEALVRAGEYLDSTELIHQGYREAFRSHPSLKHGLPLLSTAEEQGKREDEITFMIERIQSLLEEDLNTRFPRERKPRLCSASKELLCTIYLCGGKYERALALCKDEGPLGWNYGNNLKGQVVPFFLRMLLVEGDLKRAPNLKWIWEKMVRRTAKTYTESYEDSFNQVMEEALESVRLKEEEKDRYLDWCIEETGKRIDAIVGGTHRKSYNKAAALLVSMAEVLASSDKKKKGSELIERYRQKYPHHTAFQDELEEAISRGEMFN